MKTIYKKYIIIFFIFTQLSFTSSHADYPETIVGVVDLNYILSEAKAAKDAAKQIEEIAIKIEKEISDSDQTLLDEQNELVESQQIMAPAVFDEKRKEYEKKVQNYNITRQEKLMSIDVLLANTRNDLLNALKPILEEISNENGITILLEKNTVLLNAENMDITSKAMKILNKELPSIEVSN